LLQPINVSRAVLNSDNVFVLAKERYGLGFNLDSRKRRHAVENQRHRRFIGNAFVVCDQSLLGDARLIKVRSDYEKSVKGNSGSNALDFVYCSTRTLLASTDDERQTRRLFLNLGSRRRNDL
jgi:hypothetical protein